MAPRYPLIEIYGNGVNIIPDDSHLKKGTVLAVLREYDTPTVYDKQFEIWTYKLRSDRVKNSFWIRILAYTINPIIETYPAWSKTSNYQLDELKQAIIKCIKGDDDLLTQFVEPDVFIKGINQSDSFDAIYDTLNKYAFEVDEDALLTADSQ